VRTGTLSARLNDLPEADRNRIVRQFDDLDPETRRYLGRTDVDAPASKTTDLFDAANDPSSARRTLDALSESDDEAADILLDIDDPNTKWRFARAYDRGDVDSDELATALRRYDELDVEDKARARQLIEQTGDDGVRFLSRADPVTVRNVVGGPGDIDAEYARAVVRAYDRLDRPAVNRVVAKIDQLEAAGYPEAATVVKRVVASRPEGGSRLVDTFENDELRALADAVNDGTVDAADMARFADGLSDNDAADLRKLRGVMRQNDVQMEELARFVDTSDGEASTLVSRLEGQQLVRAIRLDSADRDVVIEAGIRESLNGRDDLASDSLTPSDMMELEDDIDLQDARMIARTDDGKPVALVPGTSDVGFDHLQARHFDGTEIDPDGDQPTTFFPSGADVPARGGAPAAELPSNLNRDELAPLVRAAIERSSASADDGFTVEFDQPRNGVTEMQVTIDGSRVATAYPRAGPAVKRFNWETGEWEEWTDSGWQRWEEPYESTERIRSPRPIQPDTPRTTTLGAPQPRVGT
jgi:hypothetical protein